MARYTFRDGEIIVEDGVYSPVLKQRVEDRERGVFIPVGLTQERDRKSAEIPQETFEDLTGDITINKPKETVKGERL